MNANPTNTQELVRDKLRTALLRAMRDRDPETVSALRSVLGALDNAESSGIIAPRAGAIEASAVGIGRADAARRELTDADVCHVIQMEIDERRRAAEEYARAGRPERVAGIEREIAAIRAALGE